MAGLNRCDLDLGQANDFPGTARSAAVFATETHGYIGCGHNIGVFDDFWETTRTDQWSKIETSPYIVSILPGVCN